MSQAGLTGPGGMPSVATTYVTDVNSPAVPALNILNVLGGDTTADDDDGIRTDGSSGSNTLTVQLTNRLQGSGQTIGAVTANLITFPLGAVASAAVLECRVVGFETTTPAGVGYELFGTVRTTGVAASLVGTPDRIANEDAALAAAQASLIVSGNNAIVQVLGVAGLTINWSSVALYTRVA